MEEYTTLLRSPKETNEYYGDEHDKRVMPILAIFAKTFRSLNAYQKAGEGRLSDVPLLGIWGAVGYAPLFVLRQYRSSWWWGQRVNDNIPMPNQETTRSLEEHLQVIPSELEIIKQDFEKRNLELEKKIEQLEEEKMQLGLDVDVQKLEADKLIKEKNKVEEDLDSLKIDYKKLRLSMRTAGLGKTLEQWWQEIKEEKNNGKRKAKMPRFEKLL
ncbi:hypothetical protein Gohar_028342 [Gossypium harknessii]|uniref:Uncharacterized protein n=1 Tax=Gossypium harknessii TaxID=34285 RepID=A0A7J9I9A0_9ROSI|nr:hypothetical protein [Gossypium harknessii]